MNRQRPPFRPQPPRRSSGEFPDTGARQGPRFRGQQSLRLAGAELPSAEDRRRSPYRTERSPLADDARRPSPDVPDPTLRTGRYPVARCFEDLIAWQKARELAWEIYRVTRESRFGRDLGLTDQMQRAAVSVLSNIAEGFGRGRPTEFRQFLVIAKGSCAELQAQLYVCLDAGYLSETEFEGLYELAEETAKVMTGLRNSIES